MSDYFLCVVNDFTSLDQRYLDKLTRNLQGSQKVFREVIVVHNCKTVMEQAVLDHIFESQITHVYGRGKLQTTRIAAINPSNGELVDVRIVKTSGDVLFDRSALTAVNRAAPFDEVKRFDAATFEKKFRSLTVKFRPED